MLISLLGQTTCSEDLWRRFFCVSTSLSTLSHSMLSEGLLWKNVRASISLPGIFPPLSTAHNELLIDGAITNNLPVDLMKEFCNQSYVISCKVSGQPKVKSGLVPEGWLTGWQSLKDKLRKKSLPTIPEIIMESITLCSSQHQIQMATESDLHIDCFTDKYDLLDFSVIDELVQLGYEAAQKAIAETSIQFPKA